MAVIQREKANVDNAETIVIPMPEPEQKRPGMQKIETHEVWPVLSRLSIPVSAEICIRLKVRDLLALESGRLILSSWPETEDVPVNAGGVQVGWSEFEVEDQRLMMRLTRLA